MVVPLIIQLPYDSAITLKGIYPKSLKTLTGKELCTHAFIAALFTVANPCRQHNCPLIQDWIKKIWYIYTIEYYSAIKR